MPPLCRREWPHCELAPSWISYCRRWGWERWKTTTCKVVQFWKTVHGCFTHILFHFTPISYIFIMSKLLWTDHSNFRRQQSKPEKSWLAQQWAGVDTKWVSPQNPPRTQWYVWKSRIFKPLLTHASPTLLETLPNRCIGLARVFTSREQLEKHPMMVGIHHQY